MFAVQNRKMEIVKQEFKGEKPETGRPNKYPFADLGVGDCLKIPVENNANKERKKVSTAFHGWRKYNDKLDWVTAVTVEGETICVYRL